ncbi:hypothetical protein [Phycicoccus sp.]|uniref:hypothetical protein n=1 Tax=Phycicoccus sp. TaxID=1902410 RepID=UPI002C465BD6|nr:hypothetical protein [Phycicoccus sp.]HMM95985.1 hypothetical protein [Phycicoccus sp.]
MPQEPWVVVCDGRKAEGTVPGVEEDEPLLAELDEREVRAEPVDEPPAEDVVPLVVPVVVLEPVLAPDAAVVVCEVARW